MVSPFSVAECLSFPESILWGASKNYGCVAKMRDRSLWISKEVIGNKLYKFDAGFFSSGKPRRTATFCALPAEKNPA
jgi:hypothetical protein